MNSSIQENKFNIFGTVMYSNFLLSSWKKNYHNDNKNMNTT